MNANHLYLFVKPKLIKTKPIMPAYWIGIVEYFFGVVKNLKSIFTVEFAYGMILIILLFNPKN